MQFWPVLVSRVIASAGPERGCKTCGISRTSRSRYFYDLWSPSVACWTLYVSDDAFFQHRSCFDFTSLTASQQRATSVYFAVSIPVTVTVTNSHGQDTRSLNGPSVSSIQQPGTISRHFYSVSQKKIPPKGSWHFSFFSQTVENF